MRLAALAATLAAMTVPVYAAPYTLFIFENPEQLSLRPLSGDAAAAYWNAYDAFGKALAAAGVLRGGSALTTGAPVALVGAGSGDAAGPVARSNLPLGGYFQIDVATDAEALAWAARVPTGGRGVIQVRAGYPAPGMSM